jgi:tetratricopeptide (TPR) repeat protein
MRHGRFRSALCLVVLSGWAAWSLAGPPKPPAPPAESADEDTSPEEARAKVAADSFRKVLENNPRRGTALDRLYGYHVERGTLDGLVRDYADRTKKNAKDGIAWMVLGLLESQRSRDAAAVAAFKKAEENLPDSAMPSYYLGQSLVLVGQPEAAAEAYERALSRKPNRNDLLDIFQALGRVYQRSQQPEQALAVWNRLEKLFPGDVRVQEQIATTLVEEGQYAQALPRLEKLAAQTDDKYQQATLTMDAADLKVRLKRSTEALTDFEKLLGDLEPESWLYRDVRRRIEDVFLRNDDLAGLAKYYEKWLEKNASDVDAIARLAKTLAGQGRVPEARQWLEKGIAVAPANRSLRQALVDQYVVEQNFAAAAAQYEAMDKSEPNNPDTLREWGKVLLRDSARPEAERREAAVAVWKRLVAKKPKDPVTASQVADLVRSAGAIDDAVALYKKAIELAPDSAQYREYLGEYYHSLKRSADAIATWRPIAEGGNRNAKNLSRLAEVFAGFGYRKEAVEAMRAAIDQEPDDFNLRSSAAELLQQEGRHDDALAQLDAAERLVSSPEEIEQILTARIKVYQATETLAEHIDKLHTELMAGTNATADRWLRLARYFEANRQTDKATEAIARAREKDPKSVPVLTAAARIYEAAGDMLAAADANRKLAVLDRRFRTEYLTAVAKLEQRLGRREQALQAGRDLLAASPGNPDVYKFFADLCFQLGDADEGLEALRRSVRANPSDPAGLITLANALGERVRQGEAIELLWRAFEKTNDLDGKIGVVERLTQLYLESNQFDRLIERLERERREAEKVREMTMCIAQAYATAGDLGTARGQLERLLLENSRDVHLLGQLVNLCEQEGDLAAALKYQRMVTTAAPNNYDHLLKVAQLLTRTGEAEEAADIWVKLVANESEPHRNLSAIDQLLTAGKNDAALAILSRLLLKRPGDWELLYRSGAALVAKGKPDDAAVRFKELLALKLPEDELGEIAKHAIAERKKKATKPTPPNQQTPSNMWNPYARSDEEWDLAPLARRAGRIQIVRIACGISPRNYYWGVGPPPFHAPADFGEARMATLGFLYEASRARNDTTGFLKSLRDAADKAGTDSQAVWDLLHLQALREQNKALLQTATRLSQGNDPTDLLALLTVLNLRGNPSLRWRAPGSDLKDNTPALPPDQLEHVLSCYRRLKAIKPDWVSVQVTQNVMTELKRAKRTDEEQTLYKEMVAEAKTVDRVKDALGVAATRNDLEGTLALFAKLDRLQGVPKTAAYIPQLPTRRMFSQLEILMAKRAREKKLGGVLQVLDAGMTSARRQQMAAPRTASTARRMQTTGISLWVYNAKGGGRNVTLTYPTANDYYDDQTLSLLYGAYDLFKDADLVSDLTDHLRKATKTASEAEKIYLYLALGYVHWWADDKDEALARLTEAVQAAPADHNLLLEVAAMREQNNEHAAALALLDSVTPQDTQMLVRREEAALRLAERTGNVDRARKAADRLFGLRLETDKQLELAGKMHRLGLPAMAETVLSRAQRQAGNKTATLLKLMTQYQSQNQSDLAVQIARQILRKGPTLPNPYARGTDETENARSQAIGVLARSGQLKELIERAEAQLKASPRSVPIYQSLAAYYQAAGDKPKLKAALLKQSEIKPDDGKLRFQVAKELQQAGENDAAMQEYKAGLKIEPSLFANSSWEIYNLFVQAHKVDDLARTFDEIDVRKIGNWWAVTQPVGSLVQEDSTRDLGLKLFRKAWHAFPESQGYLLRNLYDDSLWRLPEIYDYARQALIPREDSGGEVGEWASQIMSWGQDGRMDGLINRVLSVARRQQRLPELRAEVETALARRPDWSGGKALLGVIDIQLGRREQGRREWAEAFADKSGEIGANARFLLTQELEFYAGVDDLAVKTLEDGLEDLLNEGYRELSYSPAKRLIWWYDRVDRKDDARKLRLRFAHNDLPDPGWRGSYQQYITVSNGITVAQDFLRGGDPVNAVLIYNALLADRETLDQATAWWGGGRYDRQVERELQTALKSFKPGTLPKAVGALLSPPEGTVPGRSAVDLALIVESRDASKATLDSVFAIAVRSTAKNPEVRRDAAARLAELVKMYPTDTAVLTASALVAFANGDSESIRQSVDRLVKLVESAPLETLPPNGRSNSRQRAEALRQLPVWLVARECLRPGRDANRAAGEFLARRAVDAAKRQKDQLYAAAVLREWGQLDLDRGDRVSAESHWTAMLETMLPKPAPQKAAGAAPTPPVTPPPAAPAAPSATAKKQARAPVLRQLEPTRGRVCCSPRPGTPGRGVGGEGPVASIDGADGATTATGGLLVRSGLALLLTVFQAPVPPATATPAAPATSAPKEVVPVLTADEFQRAYEAASLAADKGLLALSLRAMKDAMRGGPPAEPRAHRNGAWTPKMINGVQYYQESDLVLTIGVDEALANLQPKWRAAGATAADIYETLASAVLPAARPAEVFLYADGPSVNALYAVRNGIWTPVSDVDAEVVEERGLMRLLIDAAIEAHKVDDLRSRAEARAGQPLGELPAKVLLATLAVRTKDDARAMDAFKFLHERIRKDAQTVTNDGVCLALLPAFADPVYAERLAPVVTKAAENYASVNSATKSADLRFKLATYYRAQGDETTARTHLKAVEGLGKKVGAGQYDPHLPLAREYLKAGWIEDALRELGVNADNVSAAASDPTARAKQPEPVLVEFPLLVRRLLELPAAKRYELLKAWSLPTAGRKSIRYYVGTVPRHIPPSEFVKLPALTADRVLSTSLLLAEAAKEAGKAEELSAEAAKLATDKVEGAELLRLLVFLSQGKGKEVEPAIKAYIEAAFKRLTEMPDQPKRQRFVWNDSANLPTPFYPSEFLVATLCLADPALARHGQVLLAPMQFHSQGPTGVEYASRITAVRDRFSAARAGAPDALEAAVPPRWQNASARSIWFAEAGYLTHGWNDQPSFLLFDTPLSGTFAFSVDSYAGATVRGQAGYGGVVFEPSATGMNSAIWPVGKGERIVRPIEGVRGEEFNRLTVEVSPGKVRCLVNGNLFYEDTDPPPISPWLMLAVGDPGQRSVFRNFTLSGNPEVMPEVRLSAGDYLDGWVAQPYAGTMPQRLTAKEPEAMPDLANPRAMQSQDEPKKTPVYDWEAKGGEIRGRKLGRSSERPVPSRLAYFRPLQPGEAVRYEFYFEPGRTHVHPSVGRVAFLLEPDGVQLHWLTEQVTDDWTGLPADNGIPLSGAKSEKLPLKAGEWNTAIVRATANGVAIEVNGTPVCETRLPDDGEHQFGLFHYRDRTAVRVRNVVLTGPWPKTIGTAEEIGFTTKAPGPAAARARRRQIGERYYATDAEVVTARARSLSPGERYRLLADWVLPGESRSLFQLAGTLKPLDVLGLVNGKEQPPGRCVTQGGRLETPALELISAARAAGKLDELAERIARAEPAGSADELFARSKTALLCAVRAAQGRDSDAAAALRPLLAFAKAMPPDAPGAERWPDLIAAIAALDRTALLKDATELAEAANRNLDLSLRYFIPVEDRDVWLRLWRPVRGRAHVLAQPDGRRRPYGADPDFKHWASVPAPNAASRSAGAGVPHWCYRDGTLFHFPGHAEDHLVLRTPIGGDFEVACGLRAADWQLAQIRYGAYEFDLIKEGKKYALHSTVRQNGRETTINPPLPGKAEVYRVRLAIKDGWLRAFVDDREVVAERIGSEPDPWLMVHSGHLHDGELRDVTIHGSPTVPEAVDLLNNDDLATWRPYSGTIPEVAFHNQNPTTGWLKRGEELYEAGKKPDPPEEGKPVLPRSFPESAIFYHRPFLEDGAVEYEFYYEPDVAHTYPALDRLVFLLEPEGVKLHWLTDGALEKSAVKVDNASDEPACRRGPPRLPLRPKDWNRVRLAVTGDTVNVVLNGVEVYERPIESTNARFFGLVHWTDRTEARVRNVKMTGDWPRQLPPVDKLFEARSSGTPAANAKVTGSDDRK